MRISLNVGWDGSKNLTLMTDDGLRLMSTGILFPGTHDLGVFGWGVVVKVTHGEIWVNECRLSLAGERRAAEIAKGEKILIRNVDYAAYMILFDNQVGI